MQSVLSHYLKKRGLFQQSFRRVGNSNLVTKPPTASTRFSTSIKYLSTTTSNHYEFSEREKKFYEKGWLDERGLTVFDTLHEMITRSNQVYADNAALGTYNPHNEQFEFATYRETATMIDKCRSLLKDVGVEQHGKIGLIANNRWEWACIAAAAFSLNAVVVPMYEAQLPSDWSYIINDSGCSVLFCANDDIYSRVQKHVLPSAPLVKSVLCFDAPAEEPYSFQFHLSRTNEDSNGSLITEPLPGDLANLIYTSGTTGKPKGVELTHLNFTSNIKGSARHSSVKDPKDFVREADRTLAFLPWAHSYGQTCELWMNWAHGSSAAVCRGIPHILDDLQLVQPTVICAVPNLYKRVYDGVHNIMETSSSPIQKRLMQNALRLGYKKIAADRDEETKMGFLEQMQFQLLDSLVLSKIRDRFGGSLRHGFVAGAACPKEVLDFMDAIGIQIFEGYGLTETSPIITTNVLGQRVAGTVGRAIEGVSVYVVDENGNQVPTGEEGEICCSGLNVMKGYHRNQIETDKAFSCAPDGKLWMFHTGDLGRQDENGFLKVTGRLKERYKLENGKYVVPTPIEESIGLSRFILQVVLVGANRPHNVALLVPDWEAIKKEILTGDNDKSDIISEEGMVNDERVRNLINREIKKSCIQMKKFEVPTKWAFIERCTVANSRLTPKMSIRRHKVIETYKELISNLYGDERVVPNAADGVRTENDEAVARKRTVNLKIVESKGTKGNNVLLASHS